MIISYDANWETKCQQLRKVIIAKEQTVTIEKAYRELFSGQLAVLL